MYILPHVSQDNRFLQLS